VLTDVVGVSERQREMAVGGDHQPVEAVDHVEAAREVADSRAEPGQDRAGDGGVGRPPPTAPAYAVRVRDQWLTWNVGGHPALEFCNTYAGWGAPGELSSEWVRGYATLAVWAEQHDLASSSTVSGLLRQARRAPHAGAEGLARARRLRSALYACLTDPADRKAFATVARFASEAAHVSVFTAGDDGLGRWVLPAEVGLALPLHAAARSAADLLADPRRFTVCACPGVHCGWLLLNPSGRRAFCSAATCSSAGSQDVTLRRAR
jgi:SARP family transcriptional regulator, regulator of embCAB operon